MIFGIIIVFILFIVLVYIILLNINDNIKYGKKKDILESEKEIKHDIHKKKINSEKNNEESLSFNYITPTDFKVGLLTQHKYSSANNCDHRVLYPINGLGPEYGWKMPKNCRCTEFVRSP